MIRAAQLREQFNIQGQHTPSALAYRNKIVMKKYLVDSDVGFPGFSEVTLNDDITGFIKKKGFPVVVKPSAESGSFGTAVLRDQTDLQNYLAQPFQGEREVETFINGEMFHVDGLVVNGEVKIIQPSKYVNDCLAFRRDEFLGSYFLSPENQYYDRLIAITRLVLQALPGARNMAFHAEFWVTPEDRIVFCEIASRTGGAMISTAFQQKFGINIDQEWLLAECGIFRPFSLSSSDTGGWVVIPPKKGILQELPKNLPNFIESTQYCGQEGERFNGGVKSGLFLAGYVVGGKTEEMAEGNIRATAEWFGENSKWQLS